VVVVESGSVAAVPEAEAEPAFEVGVDFVGTDAVSPWEEQPTVLRMRRRETITTLVTAAAGRSLRIIGGV